MTLDCMTLDCMTLDCMTLDCMTAAKYRTPDILPQNITQRDILPNDEKASNGGDLRKFDWQKYQNIKISGERARGKTRINPQGVFHI